MNLHPIFVHFPIAFLTIYALLECIPMQKLRGNQTFTAVKAFLLVIGTLSAFVTFQTGEMAEEIYGEHPLTEMHSLLATVTLWVFGFTSVICIFTLTKNWLTPRVAQKFEQSSAVTKLFQKICAVSTFIFNTRYLIIPLALAGLAAITITGALGGALVYGPDVDPVVGFIYNIFF